MNALRFFAILVCLQLVLVTRHTYAADPYAFTRSEAKEVNSLGNTLLEGLANYFNTDPNTRTEPEFINEFKLDPVQKLAFTRQVNKLKKDLKKVAKRKQKRVLKQKNKKSSHLRVFRISSNSSSQDSQNDSSTMRCVSACAYAAAWANVSCFAKACAWCPGRRIFACGYARASATAFGYGSACISRCKDVKKPKC